MSRSKLLTLAPVVVALTFGAQSAAAEGVWVHGKAHRLITGPASSQATAPATLYVIAPVRRLHPLHPLADSEAMGWGAHDHVAATVFSGPCDLTMVLPGARAKGKIKTRRTQTPDGPEALVYAARLRGRMRPLTSAGRIQRAENEQLVTTVDTKTVIHCTVKP